MLHFTRWWRLWCLHTMICSDFHFLLLFQHPLRLNRRDEEKEEDIAAIDTHAICKLCCCSAFVRAASVACLSVLGEGSLPCGSFWMSSHVCTLTVWQTLYRSTQKGHTKSADISRPRCGVRSLSRWSETTLLPTDLGRPCAGDSTPGNRDQDHPDTVLSASLHSKDEASLNQTGNLLTLRE